MSPQSRRKSSQAVAIGAVTALAVALTGCSSEDEQETDAEYAQICVNQDTQERVEDNQCDDHTHSHSNFGWMWLPFFLGNNRANTIPAVGQRITTDHQATREDPRKRDRSTTTVGTAGGSVSKNKNGKTSVKSGTSRGGFGSKGGGSGS